jgi:cytochrome c
MRYFAFAAATLGFALLGVTATQAQDATAGAEVFKKCRACHQIGDGAKNMVGPVLTGVVGRPAGTYPGYNYSDANKSSGIVWDEATLKVYLKDRKTTSPTSSPISRRSPPRRPITEPFREGGGARLSPFHDPQRFRRARPGHHAISTLLSNSALRTKRGEVIFPKNLFVLRSDRLDVQVSRQAR